MSVSSFASAVSHKSNSRPSSVIGDVHVVNIDPNNQPNLSSFKPTPVSVNYQLSSELEQGVNFIRGSVGNPSRNSSRNRVRLSAGPEATFGVESSTKSVDNTKVASSLVPSRAFIAGHSRAASADISGYSTVGYGKQHNSSPSPSVVHTFSSPNDRKSDIPRNNRNMHHVRNNSVDNSLVTSGYQTFAINSGSQTSIATTSAASSSKPAIPAKPSGIVSVFVPGSTNLTHSANNNKSTGNIYGKVSLNSNQSFGAKEPPNVKSTANQSLHGNKPIEPKKPINHSLYPVPPPRKVNSQFVYLLLLIFIYNTEASRIAN